MDVRRSRHLTVLLLALLIGASGCGGEGGSDNPVDPGEPGGAETVVITLTSDLTFSPSDVTVSPGTTVRWVNATDIGHTVTPDGHSEWTEWATGATGESFEHQFTTTGTFDYYCVPHRSLGMTGVIRVQ